MSHADIPENAIEIVRVEIVEYLDPDDGDHRFAYHRDGDVSDMHVLGLLRHAEIFASRELIRDALEDDQ